MSRVEDQEAFRLLGCPPKWDRPNVANSLLTKGVHRFLFRFFFLFPDSTVDNLC